MRTACWISVCLIITAGAAAADDATDTGAWYLDAIKELKPLPLELEFDEKLFEAGRAAKNARLQRWAEREEVVLARIRKISRRPDCAIGDPQDRAEPDRLLAFKKAATALSTAGRWRAAIGEPRRAMENYIALMRLGSHLELNRTSGLRMVFSIGFRGTSLDYLRELLGSLDARQLGWLRDELGSIAAPRPIGDALAADRPIYEHNTVELLERLNRPLTARQKRMLAKPPPVPFWVERLRLVRSAKLTDGERLGKLHRAEWKRTHDLLVRAYGGGGYPAVKRAAVPRREALGKAAAGETAYAKLARMTHATELEATVSLFRKHATALANRRGTRVMVALALRKAGGKAYPATLIGVEGVSRAMRTDPFDRKPVSYSRTESGYALVYRDPEQKDGFRLERSE